MIWGNRIEIHPQKFGLSIIRATAFIFVINLLYCTILVTHPRSRWYHIWDKDIDYITETISSDTGTYLEPGPLRTIGYQYILKFNPALILIFNCLLGAWMFYVVYQLIGSRAFILVLLGAFTAHVPSFLTDLLFAAIFVTSIWQIKRLWLHLLLLGVASLIRPSLAWFFLIEPIVLYFYGYRGRVLILAGVLCFVVTSFTPIRNLVLYDQWTHSTVLDHNIEMFKASDLPKYLYLVNTFKINCLEGHPALLHKQFYPWALGVNFLLIIANIIIWISFLSRLKDVNYGNLLMVIYFIIPSLFAPAAARIRLPIEWILLL